jgi:hypothetical protein
MLHVESRLYILQVKSKIIAIKTFVISMEGDPSKDTFNEGLYFVPFMFSVFTGVPNISVLFEMSTHVLARKIIIETVLNLIHLWQFLTSLQDQAFLITGRK